MSHSLIRFLAFVLSTTNALSRVVGLFCEPFASLFSCSLALLVFRARYRIGFPGWANHVGVLGLWDLGSLIREDFQDSDVKSRSYFVPKRPVTRDANHLVRCKWEQTYHL